MSAAEADDGHGWDDLFPDIRAIEAASGFPLDGRYMAEVWGAVRDDIMRVFCEAIARHGEMDDGLRVLMERAYLIGFIHGHDDYEALYPERIPDDDA